MIWSQPKTNLYPVITAFKDLRMAASSLVMTKTTDCGASGQSAGVTGTIPAFDLQRAQTLDSKQARSSASVKTRFPFFHHCVTLRFVISGELLDDTTQATSVFYDNQAE